MKRFTTILLSLFAVSFLFFSFPACHEKSLYKLEERNELVINAAKQDYDTYGLEKQELKYVASYTLSDGKTVFFQEGFNHSKAETFIKDLENLFQIVKGTNIVNLYVGNTPSTYLYEDSLWINGEDCIEQLLAVILSELDAGRYPFGFYAGQAVYLLKQQGLCTLSLYDERTYNSLQANYANHKDLQYPLYFHKYVTKEEYSLAWTFSFALVKEIYQCFDIQDEEKIRSYLETQSNISRLHYQFELNDSYYPIKVNTPNVIYYFCDDFTDAVLKETEFKLKYSDLKNLLIDTNSFIQTTREALGKNKNLPEKVNAYFGNDLLTTSDGHGGQTLGVSYQISKQIICKSFVVFTHMLMRQILHFENYMLYFKDEFCELFANKTVWRKYYFYYIYSGDYSLEAEYENFDEILNEARLLYQKYATGLDVATFDTKIWNSCLAKSMNEKEDTFVLNCQTNSFLLYVYENYGMDGVKKICNSLSSTINGKTFDVLTQEWRLFLKTQFA